MRVFFLGLLVFLQVLLQAVPMEDIEQYANFGGRISKVGDSSLIRFGLDFANRKYLNKGDSVSFWHQGNRQARCFGKIVGKTADHILVQMDDPRFCRSSIGTVLGTYMRFHSEDMKNNMIMGVELMDILLKKKTAVAGKLERTKRDLDGHIEKVSAINARYDILRKELESEWQEQLQNLEEDRMTMLREQLALEKELEEVDAKLERYKIEEDHFSLDRWSLDRSLYYKK